MRLQAENTHAVTVFDKGSPSHREVRSFQVGNTAVLFRKEMHDGTEAVLWDGSAVRDKRSWVMLRNSRTGAECLRNNAAHLKSEHCLLPLQPLWLFTRHQKVSVCSVSQRSHSINTAFNREELCFIHHRLVWSTSWKTSDTDAEADGITSPVILHRSLSAKKLFYHCTSNEWKLIFHLSWISSEISQINLVVALQKVTQWDLESETSVTLSLDVRRSQELVC